MKMQFWIDKGIHLGIGFVIIIVTFVVAHFVQKSILQYNNKKEHQQNTFVIAIIAQVMYYTIVLVGFMIIMRMFGIEVTSIIAIASALAFAIGMSLQGSLSDVAAGIMMTFFNVFNIGDVITVSGVEGKVIDFKLIHTVLEDLGTKGIIIIPNRNIQGGVVTNISKAGVHYFMIDILLSNKNKNFDRILGVIRENLKDTKKFPDVLQNLPHRVSVLDMAGPGTTLRIRVPVTTDGDIGVKRGQIRSALRTVMEGNGVELLDPSSISATR